MIDVDCLIFDLDGTLVNSLGDIVQSVNHTLRTMGFEPLPESTIKSFVGDGIQSLLHRCLERRVLASTADLDRAYLTYTSHHDQHCLDTTNVYEGIPEILEHFENKKKAVLTNKSQRYARRVVDGLGLARHFRMVVGGDTLAFRKPDPRAVHYVLRQLDAIPSRSIIIGDGPQDVAAGMAAHVHTCGVTYGFRERAELEAADFLVDDPRQLKELIR